MKALAIFGGVILAGVLIIGLTFWLNWLGLVNLEFFGPKYEAANRKIYEETPSYVEGKEQTLAELRMEYNKAKTDGERQNIKAMIVNEAATVDLDKFKDDSLRRFVERIRGD